jgi:hypothetical protein
LLGVLKNAKVVTGNPGFKNLRKAERLEWIG